MHLVKTVTTAFLVSILTVIPVSGKVTTLDSLEMVLAKHTQIDTTRINLLNSIAYEIRLQDPEKTKLYAKQSLELSTQLNYPKGRAASLWLTGIVTLNGGKEASIDPFLEALKIAEEIGDKTGQCNYLIAIGNITKLHGDTKTGEAAHNRALKIAQQTNDQQLILKVQFNNTKSKIRNGQHIEAIQQLQEIIETASRIGYIEMAARAYADLSQIYYAQGNYPAALEYALASMEINEERSDYVGIYDNQINIANIQSKQGDLGAALKTVEKAQQQAIQKRDSVRISHCLNYLGNIFQLTNRPEAFSYFQQSMALSKFNKPAHNIDNLLNIGAIYTSRAEFGRAQESLSQALELAEHLEAKLLQGKVYEKLGALYFAQKDYVQAKKHTQQAIALAKTSQFKDLEKDCYKQLAEIDAAAGNFKGAYASMKEYDVLKDSLFNEKNTREIAFLESSYKFDKEREVHKQEHLRGELRIKSQQQTILQLVTISLLVLILTIAIYWSGRLKKKVLRLEIEKINAELETNQKFMAVAKLKLVQNSERDTHHVKLLEQIEQSPDKGQEENLSTVINDYKLQSQLSNWGEFEMLFTKVNASFLEKLNKACPTLSPNERKLCIFLKLNMGNKDIAQITFQTEEALKKSRQRLRKKFELGRGDSLAVFIQNL